MRQITTYEKGGIGKSTITQNLTMALATMGNKILLVGCGPKEDSTRMLLSGLNQKTVLDTLRNEGNKGVDFENDHSKDMVKNFVFTVLYRNPETYYLID